MPRPLRPCLAPSCPTLVASGYCPTHRQERRKDPAQARFYSSSRWRRISELVRRSRPYCELCKKVRSQEVHHRDHDYLNCTIENLVAVCRACHLSETASYTRRKSLTGAGL